MSILLGISAAIGGTILILFGGVILFAFFQGFLSWVLSDVFAEKDGAQHDFNAINDRLSDLENTKKGGRK